MAAERTSEGFADIYKGLYGMKRTEWRVLFHLGRYGRMTAQEIGARARVHKTKISRAVRDLESKRFLTRSDHDLDRRREILSLLKAGESAYGFLVERASAYERDLQNRLTRREAQTLKSALRKLAQFD
jgi:DNA-binding MarR family transcriptional regulator